jgi:uncharacterized protein (DUF362 family)
MNNRSRRKAVVGVIKVKEARYPNQAPYHPSMAYPEYPFSAQLSSEPNYVYDGIRQLFFQLGFDRSHWNSREWNPLGQVIKPGMKVVIKPNFVLSKHLSGKNVFAIITHPSVIRAIADYCWIALKRKGSIIIADAPQYNCDFKELLEATKLEKIRDFINSFSGVEVDIRDLRDYWSKTRHFPSCIRELPGDPQGRITVSLGKESALYNYAKVSKLYGAVYHRDETICHHSGERQEYELSRTVFDADFIIFVPKLKVHKKVGVTLNLKGLVGTCTNKNLVVHYTLGSPSEGGDQYPDGLFSPPQHAAIKFERWMYDRFLAKRTVRHELAHRLIYGFFYLRVFSHLGFGIPEEKRLLDAGNWYGNDTAWRMAVDLAKIIHFVDKKGKLRTEPQRRMLSIVDGVIGGENNGPLAPDPKPAGVLVGGDSLLAVDLVGTRLMGFDPLKLKQFTMLDPKYDFGPRKLEEIEARSNERIFQDLTDKETKFLAFKPHPGWTGHIEITEE